MPVTFTENVQVTFVAVAVVASVAPLRLMADEPATAMMVCPVMLPLAEQLGVVKPLGVAMTRPSGRASVKFTPVKALEFGLVTVNVRVLGLVGMDAGEKAFAKVGGLGAGQPVIVTLSINTLAPGFAEAAPVILNLKAVVLEPVAAANPVTEFHVVPLVIWCLNENPLNSPKPPWSAKGWK